MVQIVLQIDTSVEVSEQTYEFIRDGIYLRGMPMETFLLKVLHKYGTLSEETILKFMEEYWVL